jgi:hypothetical protein
VTRITPNAAIEGKVEDPCKRRSLRPSLTLARELRKGAIEQVLGNNDPNPAFNASLAGSPLLWTCSASTRPAIVRVEESGELSAVGSSAGSPAMKDSENNWPLDLLACLAPTRELGLEKVEGDHITTPSIRFRTALSCE